MNAMVYICRRRAACARVEDLGEWVSSWERRSDLACLGEISTGRAVAS
jgi:hypothetical protein